MKKNIAIMGTGAYGTVLANVLADNNNNVTMYGIDENQIKDINNKNLNSVFFGDIFINKNIKATNNIKDALKDSEVVIICVPTIAINSILDLLKQNLDHKVHLINTAKGLDIDNLGFLSDKIKNFFKGSDLIKSFGGLYGPSLAKECIERKPTCVMIVNDDIKIAEELSKLFSNDYFFTKTTTDIRGCEIAAALKNTIAIACGLLHGFQYGSNAHASLITIGNMEIYKFASYFGAKTETFLNFATIGDLVLTASSQGSRNFSLGASIAHTNNAKKVLDIHKVTVEGVATCKAAVKICKKYNISMPLFELMYEILYNNAMPSILIQNVFKNSMANQ